MLLLLEFKLIFLNIWSVLDSIYWFLWWNLKMPWEFSSACIIFVFLVINTVYWAKDWIVLTPPFLYIFSNLGMDNCFICCYFFSAFICSSQTPADPRCFLILFFFFFFAKANMNSFVDFSQGLTAQQNKKHVTKCIELMQSRTQ